MPPPTAAAHALATSERLQSAIPCGAERLLCSFQGRDVAVPRPIAALPVVEFAFRSPSACEIRAGFASAGRGVRKGRYEQNHQEDLQPRNHWSSLSPSCGLQLANSQRRISDIEFY